MFVNNHSCRILLNLFLTTAFFETFLLIAIATLKLFEVFINLCDESISGFDEETAQEIQARANDFLEKENILLEEKRSCPVVVPSVVTGDIEKKATGANR